MFNKTESLYNIGGIGGGWANPYIRNCMARKAANPAPAPSTKQ